MKIGLPIIIIKRSEFQFNPFKPPVIGDDPLLSFPVDLCGSLQTMAFGLCGALRKAAFLES